MVALYDYEAAKADELTFNEGDIIIVINKVDGGWWEGQKLSDKKTGWFPCNYVGPLTSVSYNAVFTFIFIPFRKPKCLMKIKI